jgi:peptidoglycan/xylan/chitin deacetylase (PgdA/CDA1 family)
MRLDRSITLGPGALYAKLLHPKGISAAILMYHAVVDEIENSGHAYFNTAVSPERFAEHLRILSEQRYHVVALGALNELHNKGNGTCDEPLNVVITFDDAFLSVVENALPLLRQNGFPATVYVPTGFIETGKRLLPHRPHMNWNDARRLLENGITLGSHTVNHTNLRNLTYRQIDDELEQSKHAIEHHTGTSVLDFSCPFSFPEEDRPQILALRESLAKHGYRTGVTTRIGRASSNDDAYTLRRLPVNDNDDDKLFRAKLAGAYDWLAPLQRAKKRIFPQKTIERS